MTELGKRFPRRVLLGGAVAGIGVLGLGAGASPSYAGTGGQVGRYPKGVRPEILHTLTNSALSDVERVVAATLQGVVARRSGEGIYLNVPDIGYGTWLTDLAERHGVDVRPAEDLWALVDLLKPAGYVLYANGPSVNVATTVAGLRDAVAVEESLEATAVEHGLTRLDDVRDRTDQWAWEQYAGQVTRVMAVEQRPELSALRDYAVLARSYTFFDGNTDFRRTVVNELDEDAATFGWGDASGGEDVFVRMSSEAGVHTIPSDHASNLSVLSGITVKSLRQKGSGALPPVDPNAHYAAFLLTDGDNVQWLLGDHQSSPKWYGSELRGEFPMGWGIAPSLIEVAPSVMQWYYDHQSTGERSDRFVAGPSGDGYLYPGSYPRAALERHTQELAALMSRADLNVAQIIDFHTLDDTALWATYLRHEHIGGLIYIEYSPYDGQQGKVVWAENKPVVSVRSMLWDGIDGADEATVTRKLNEAPRNPKETTGYSIVAVHAWSKDLSHVKTVVDGLDPAVRVVTPDVLVGLMAQHVER